MTEEEYLKQQVQDQEDAEEQQRRTVEEAKAYAGVFM